MTGTDKGQYLHVIFDPRFKPGIPLFQFEQLLAW